MTPAAKLQEAAKLVHLAADELARAARQGDPRRALGGATSALLHARDAQAYLAWVALDEAARTAEKAPESTPKAPAHPRGVFKGRPGHPGASWGVVS